MSHSPRLSSVDDITANCLWCHKLITRRENCDALTWKVLPSSLCMDLIQGHIHDCSCQNTTFWRNTLLLRGLQRLANRKYPTAMFYSTISYILDILVFGILLDQWMKLGDCMLSKTVFCEDSNLTNCLVGSTRTQNTHVIYALCSFIIIFPIMLFYKGFAADWPCDVCCGLLTTRLLHGTLVLEI